MTGASHHMEDASHIEIPAEYTRLEIIGVGMGTAVYRVARQGSEYALKIAKDPIGPDGHAMTAFRREAALLARVYHPWLPRIHEVGEHQGHPYLVMDVIRGKRLSDRILSTRLTEQAALMVIMDVAGALAAAHRAGLIHRDVKPDNILINAEGHGCLVDFGMATRPTAETSNRLAGTLMYSAPEQSGLLGRPVDERSDLYSLGAVLFECLTGAPPFIATDLGEMLHAQAHETAPDPRQFRPEISETTSVIIGRLLAKDPDDRYQCGDDLLVDLHRAVDGEPAGPLRHGALDQRVHARPETAMVGREAELKRLRDCWRDALEGQGNVLIIRGPGGIGKTRLVSEFMDTISQAGHVALFGRCLFDAPEPLIPLRSAIADHVRNVQQMAEPQRSAALGRIRSAVTPVASILAPTVPELAPIVETMVEDSDGEDRREPAAIAVATYLENLALTERGMVLHLDDGHRSDKATLEALRRLTKDLPQLPLLILITARDDSVSEEGLAALQAACSSRPMNSNQVESLVVGGLGDREIQQLIRTYLPGADIDVRHLATRSDGNPFALLEYLRLIVETGLLRPSWGTWILDIEELDRLELPENTLMLVERRISALSEEARAVLGTAAVCGDRFTDELVATAHGTDRGKVASALQEATEHHLVEARRHGCYGFLHDRIVEALLCGIDEDAKRELHQRVAEALDERQLTDPASVYATAHHYLRGQTSRLPQRLLSACAAAGQAAMAANSPADALAFLEPAREVAEANGVSVNGRFCILLGEAQHQCGRFTSAAKTLDRALEVESDPLIRAKAYSRLAQAHVGLQQLVRAVELAKAGLVELGSPHPRRRVPLFLSTLWRVVTAAILEWLGAGRGAATGEQRVRDVILTNLYETIAQAHALDLHRWPALVAAARTLPPVHRIGPSVEYSRAYSSLGYSCRMFGLTRLADWLFAQSATSAEKVPNPRVAAIAAYPDAVSDFLCGADDGQRLAQCLQVHGRWLEISIYREAINTLSRYEAVRGNTADSETWYQRGTARLGNSEEAGLHTAAIALDALTGRGSGVANRLAALSQAPSPRGRGRQLESILIRLHVAVEQGDLGPEFEQLASAFPALGISPREITQRFRPIYIHLALGRLEQCRVRTDLPIEQRVHNAHQAIRSLGLHSNSTLMHAFHHVAEASLRQLCGDDSGALRKLAQAERFLRQAGSPLADYEAARVKARAFTTMGCERSAREQAQFALMLATQNGWTFRMRWIIAEFGATDVSAGYFRPSTSGGTRMSNTSARRRLAALEQVSLAASRILDPDELARVALDETIRILDADRALLFLTEGDQLTPHLGRDSAGNDLTSFGGFSTTLVERVHETRDVLVVTGTEEGLALGASSMITHGLLSIMAAPLQLEGKIIGVVYLDSRVAKGIFTSEDASLILAIANQIALSLENARAACQQKLVAERLRAAMTVLGETLDPDQVLVRLLEHLLELLAGERGWLLRRGGYEDGLAIAASIPRTRPGSRRAIRVSPVSPLTLVLSGGNPVSGQLPDPPPSELAELIGGAPQWIVVPLGTAAESIGVIVVVSTRTESPQPQVMEAAAVLVRYAMTAHDNARNFTQIRELASTDGLTGVASRRHFFELATGLVADAGSSHTPLTVMMLDIDRFKEVNDTFGHHIGDEVICGVVARIRTVIRERDLLGRYGGEEFALLLPKVGDHGPDVAERVRASVANTPIATSMGSVPITVSVGVTVVSHVDETGEDVFTLLESADRALYEAKFTGRDRVIVLPLSPAV